MCSADSAAPTLRRHKLARLLHRLSEAAILGYCAMPVPCNSRSASPVAAGKICGLSAAAAAQDPDHIHMFCVTKVSSEAVASYTVQLMEQMLPPHVLPPAVRAAVSGGAARGQDQQQGVTTATLQ